MIVYLVAVSKYADVVGAKLIEAFKRKNISSLNFLGIGGPKMKEAGLNAFSDIFARIDSDTIYSTQNLATVHKIHNEIVNDIIANQPDVLITIGNWDFCSQIHKKVRKANINTKQVQYVAPKAFERNNEIAVKMASELDLLLTVFPTEDKFFKSAGVEAKFVGHPIIEDKLKSQYIDDFDYEHDLSSQDNIIAILLGSNPSDVKRMLPVFLEAGEIVSKKVENVKFVIPAHTYIKSFIEAETSNSKLRTIVVDAHDRERAIISSAVAMTSSEGTTLELAVERVPHVVAYRSSFLAICVPNMRKNDEYFEISNKILGRKVVDVFKEGQATPEKIAKATLALLGKDELYSEQIKAFDELKTVLSNGGRPSDNAVDAIMDMFDREMCVDGVKCIYDFSSSKN